MGSYKPTTFRWWVVDNEVYEKFAKKPSCKLLLLSDAGAEGLNLSGCKYLIEMEPADCYMIQTQRHGRIERADSVYKNVFVYQLIAVNSFDEIGQRIIEKKEKFDRKISQITSTYRGESLKEA